MASAGVEYHVASKITEVDASAWVANELGALDWRPDGLYVATSTAGRWESVEFWRAATETGLAFANPRLFPWTLANSPTGSIGKTLGVRGPTYTLVGRADALVGAFEHASDDLAREVVTTAAVVAFDVADDRTACLAAVLVKSPVFACQLGIRVEDIEGDDRPSELLSRVLADARSAAVERRSLHSGNV